MAPGDDPECWAWVADGTELRLDPRAGRLTVIEPGKQSARYAHELFFENERRDALPLADRGGCEGMR